MSFPYLTFDMDATDHSRSDGKVEVHIRRTEIADNEAEALAIIIAKLQIRLMRLIKDEPDAQYPMEAAPNM